MLSELLGWVRMIIERAFGYFTGVIETRYPSFLALSDACPGMGWRMCVELIFGCV